MLGANVCERLSMILSLRSLLLTITTLSLFWASPSGAVLDAKEQWLRGHFVEAIEQLQQERTLAATPTERAEQWLLQGESYRSLGRWTEAGEAFDEALRVATEGGVVLQQGQILSALARVHANDSAKDSNNSAENLLTRARDLLTPLGPSAELAEVQIQLGERAVRRGDSTAAAALYDQARQTANRATAPLATVGVLLAQARLQIITKQSSIADQTLSIAVARLRAAPPAHQTAMAHLAVGWIYRALSTTAGVGRDHHLRAAYDAFRAGLNVAQGIQDDYATALANAELGALYSEQGRLQEGLQFYRRALFTAQTLSVPIQYRWEWQSARLLERLGQHEPAIQGYRRAIEQLQGLRPATATATDAADRFRESTGALFLELANLLLHRAEQTDSEEGRGTLLRQVQTVLEQLKTAELKDYFKDECLRDPQAQGRGLSGAQAEDTTAVLYPLLLPDRTVMLVSRGEHIFQRISPLPTTEVVDNAHRLRALLEKRSTYQYLAPARRLYEALIKPLEADLVGVDTLVFVPDGALRLLPLAALNDGAHYLLERFAVATSPGLGITDLGDANQRGGRSALITALTEARQGFPALPNVALETANLEKLFPATVLRNKNFELEKMHRSLSDNTYNIIHLASHGHFEEKGQESFILTYDEHLTLDQLERFIRLTRFRDEPVELLTMSACQTAVGDDRAALGLGGVAVKAGARSALATLWLVNDEATTRLMAEFYQQLADSRQSKAQALRQAQMVLLKAGPYRHAGLWAPFLLIGNWH
ncbi:conserved hypothetical protein [Gammaproteobacteria bacterium]